MRGAGTAECCVLSYEGCKSCKPERQLRGRVRHGPAAGMLARTGLAFAATIGLTQCPGFSGAAEPDLGPPPSRMEQPVFHIVEEAGGIRHLTECEVPAKVYNDARIADLAARYPDLSPGVLEHLSTLEPFLDTAILAGFSYGVVMKGSLLGHTVSRDGVRV